MLRLAQCLCLTVARSPLLPLLPLLLLVLHSRKLRLLVRSGCSLQWLLLRLRAPCAPHICAFVPLLPHLLLPQLLLLLLLCSPVILGPTKLNRAAAPVGRWPCKCLHR